VQGGINRPGHERAQATGLRRLRMELTEALISGARDEIIEISFTGDEDEWSEIAAVLKESDSDLATELGLKIREALRTAGQ
jgi:hypothetical protein